MSVLFWLPLAVVLSSMIPGLAIFLLREDQVITRTTLNVLGALTKLALIAAMVLGVYRGQLYETRFPLMPGFDLVLHASALPMLFVVLSAVLWLITTIYAIGYLERSPGRSRFFGFFSVCVSATTGIALSGNLFTFVLFYELLTLATYPLVVHRGTREALRAGKIYLAYTLTGGTVLMVAVVWMHAVVGPFDFMEGGALATHFEDHRQALTILFWVMVASLGVKAALVPLHGWLPVAMVAPAPVSALLHAVAVVKAGAYGIVRLVYDVYGITFVRDLGLGTGLAIWASITIIYASLRALSQDKLKRMLAYSTVSQVAYIILGVGLGGPLASVGGIVHLVHQGVMKITLFFCAGNLAETLGIHRISQTRGVARRMPWTMAAFTVGALGMIGVPPLAGFISKWSLGTGAAASGSPWALAVLAISSALNAAYFLPVVFRAYFQEPLRPWPRESEAERFETHLSLLLPPVITALFVIAMGLAASSTWSPLSWVELLVARIYPGPASGAGGM
ncbi:monovalent cation/H+ antiporter subunit D family protein [Lujinxingia vulgaris]|uniref:Monovalent cation/H+ antiporter subunit D family protein n=2 Tax=Lujinxingia vulgaris TaxID=2600176 RepID=A0A5C6XMC6_9DELT|nr:proton-conducting transporter membrane subunit [Lujinxingia vulgaris]TXD39375.1 monovalent cation/H+ antiporter subunit D family protein [Lujinxingia vulgaris]